MRPIPRITESESGISNTTWLSVGKPVFASTIEQWSLLAQCRNHSGAFSSTKRKPSICVKGSRRSRARLRREPFTQILGFRLVDENAPLWFLHCANNDHCSIVLAKTGLPTLNHVVFEMPDSDSVMRGIGRMKDSGYPVEWGPGRH